MGRGKKAAATVAVELQRAKREQDRMFAIVLF